MIAHIADNEIREVKKYRDDLAYARELYQLTHLNGYKNLYETDVKLDVFQWISIGWKIRIEERTK